MVQRNVSSPLRCAGQHRWLVCWYTAQGCVVIMFYGQRIYLSLRLVLMSQHKQQHNKVFHDRSGKCENLWLTSLTALHHRQWLETKKFEMANVCFIIFIKWKISEGKAFENNAQPCCKLLVASHLLVHARLLGCCHLCIHILLFFSVFLLFFLGKCQHKQKNLDGEWNVAFGK
jgi:hypothetical protein